MTPFPDPQLEQILQAGHPRLHFMFILLAAVLGIGLILYDSRSWRMGLKRKAGLMAVVFGGGLFGSAIPDMLAGNIMQWRAQQCAITPKTIIAGLLFGFVGATVYKKMLHIHEPTSDAFVRGTCLMMAIGRIGCFVQHCCFGVATSSRWGVDFGDGVRRVPTQLLESAGLWIAFGGMFWLHRKNAWPDRRFFIFFAFYGGLRFLLEFMRETIADPIGPLGYYQWLSLLLVVTGLYQIARRTPSSLGDLA